MFGLLLAVIYLSFISLGLPDALLGASWPVMYPQIGADVSWMGMIGVVMAFSTVVSSLLADRLNRRFGTGLVTAVSTAIAALSLAGFGCCREFWQLMILAVPYGLGAGSIDAALNNYVAVHYESRHMSWLHCMWGVGAATGPVIMSFALIAGQNWNGGYLWVSAIQWVLTVILFCSLPLWKNSPGQLEEAASESLSFRQLLQIPGAPEVMVAFFCYCGMEVTAGSWASSYFVLKEGISSEQAAQYASLFYIGMTVGRAISGFVTAKLTDRQMILLGQAMVACGILLMLLPLGTVATVVGLVCMGLGCAPIYPCIIHSTPAHFGVARSQAMIGLQMASAYVGCCAVSPVFGVLMGAFGAWLLPFYLLAVLAVMAVMYASVCRKTASAS